MNSDIDRAYDAYTDAADQADLIGTTAERENAYLTDIIVAAAGAQQVDLKIGGTVVSVVRLAAAGTVHLPLMTSMLVKRNTEAFNVETAQAVNTEVALTWRREQEGAGDLRGVFHATVRSARPRQNQIGGASPTPRTCLRIRGNEQ